MMARCILYAAVVLIAGLLLLSSSRTVDAYRQRDVIDGYASTSVQWSYSHRAPLDPYCNPFSGLTPSR